jgi:hypothetical protein
MDEASYFWENFRENISVQAKKTSVLLPSWLPIRGD